MKGVWGSKGPHGTINRYTTHGCRCRACRDAIRDYYRAKRGSVPWDEYIAARPRAEHGSEARYRTCRCDKCREAARVGRARRRAREAA